MSGNKQRVIFYVDGFNFYYGLKSKNWKQFYWLDMIKFVNQFLKPHQELIEVQYFSATPTNKGKSARQDLLFSANNLNSKFKLTLGKFLKKTVIHSTCGLPYITFEEKETDVQIATNLIRDVVKNRCDISIIISADSDLIPPLKFIKELNEKHKIFAYFPPNRFSFDLAKHTNGYLKLENHFSKFYDSKLPDVVILRSGYKIRKPQSWP